MSSITGHVLYSTSLMSLFHHYQLYYLLVRKLEFYDLLLSQPIHATHVVQITLFLIPRRLMVESVKDQCQRRRLPDPCMVSRRPCLDDHEDEEDQSQRDKNCGKGQPSPAHTKTCLVVRDDTSNGGGVVDLSVLAHITCH